MRCFLVPATEEAAALAGLTGLERGPDWALAAWWRGRCAARARDGRLTVPVRAATFESLRSALTGGSDDVYLPERPHHSILSPGIRWLCMQKKGSLRGIVQR